MKMNKKQYNSVFAVAAAADGYDDAVDILVLAYTWKSFRQFISGSSFPSKVSKGVVLQLYLHHKNLSNFRKVYANYVSFAKPELTQRLSKMKFFSGESAC